MEGPYLRPRDCFAADGWLNGQGLQFLFGFSQVFPSHFQIEDLEKGLALGPFLGTFISDSVAGKKGSVSLVDYKHVEKATGKFQQSNILGEGGFGCVYKATLDEINVAFKKLHCERQEAVREFENEVDILTKIQHPNIIAFLGFCINNDSRFIIYELMQMDLWRLSYNLHGKLTDKSDVYAYGITLLELLLGRKLVEKLSPAQCQSIVTWVLTQLTDRAKLPSIVDPVIKNTMDLMHLFQVAAVAVLCVQPEPSYRPLITDELHSLIPLVPIELGGTLRVSKAGH